VLSCQPPNHSGLSTYRSALFKNVPGGLTGGATPVPIPNTEVKPSKADDTAAVRQWESRTLPGYKKSLLEQSSRLFSFCPRQRLLLSKNKVDGFFPLTSFSINR
jgi:hypothetical protein